MSDPLIPLGEFVAPHGIDGWLKLRLYNLESTILDSAGPIVLEKGGVLSTFVFERKKAHKGHLLVKLQGVDGINDAQGPVGSTLMVAEQALQPPEEGEYYYYQAVGLDVFDTQGVWIGKVTRIWFKEGGDLYVVSGDSKEFLIPAVKDVIEKIDLLQKKMIINPPDGLLEI